ncbi:sodium-dependent neutral amino acid transporter B(0)AT1-like isoform X2 [Mytilus trossulus]|uniref:sodium-dependent neutral amino acid transporter B(0)AT1-like isoform X2 n=1 Tax=Mytilus trossulus TaxID=6551 RepID=UPI0030043203
MAEPVKDKIEMNSLLVSPDDSSPINDPKTSLHLPSPGTSYGSTLSVGPEASTANLLKIDLEKKINRHTGEERETWGNRAEFLLSLIGYAVGLGNVWRFPYLTQKNGGGAFLIPYAVMLAIEGIPLFYLELAIGQRLRKGAVGAWNQVSPYLQGVGIASAAVSFNLALYYNTIMAWCVLYLVQSFQSPLPWSTCPTHIEGNVTIVNKECQVVYFTATFPYVVLVIFFFRGITLHGYQSGLEHLFIPEWKKLADPQVWLDAATQIFYSFGLAFGCLIALASYNPVRSNFVTEAFFVTIADFFTSIFTATVVFCVLGFKATATYEECLRDNNMTMSTLHGNGTVAKCDFKTIISESASGTGLAFIAFTEAINQFPVPQLWSVLFFLMLFTLGLDSMFGTLEGALTSINDMMLFPTARKEVVCGIVCGTMFVISLCFATTTGSYVFAMFDSFSANIPLLIIAFIECVAMSYVYGLKRLSLDVEMMVGTRPSYFFMFCWRFVGPVAMVVIFTASIVEKISNGTWYEVWDSSKGFAVTSPWPGWCQVVAALMILSSILWIPGVAIAKYFRLISWKEEVASYFPDEELIEERGIEPHEDTVIEKYLLGFK